MHDGDHNDLIWFHNKVDSVRESFYGTPTNLLLNLGKGEWGLASGCDSGRDRSFKFNTKSGPLVLIP